MCGFTRLGFCSFCRSAAILLDTDLIQDEGQAGDRCQEGTQDGCDQGVLAGQLAKAVQLLCGQDGTFHDAALDGQGLQLVLLGEFDSDPGGSDGIAGGASHCGGTVQNFREIITTILSGEISQGFLNDGVLDAGFAELLTQLGVLSDSDTLVVDEDTSGSLLNLAGQLFDDGLLALKNLCVGHNFHLRK